MRDDGSSAGTQTERRAGKGRTYTDAGWSGLALNIGFVLALIASLTPLRLIAGTNQWTGNGPYGGVVTVLAVDPKSPTNLYAAGVSGIFKSSDAGASWARASNGLVDPSVDAIAIDPVTPTTLYAGSLQGGTLAKSTNGGSSWTPSASGIPAYIDVNAVAVDPNLTSTLYAGTNTAGLYRSTDSGAHWATVSSFPTTNPITGLSAVAIPDALGGGTAIVVATNGSSIYASVDGGTTFQSLLDHISASSTPGTPVAGRSSAKAAVDDPCNDAVGSLVATYLVGLLGTGIDLTANCVKGGSGLSGLGYRAVWFLSLIGAGSPKDLAGPTASTRRPASAISQGVTLGDAQIEPWEPPDVSGTGAAACAPATNPVCRFYIPPEHGDSHFFSADPNECASVLQKVATDPNYSNYTYETPSAFYIGLPDTGSGACPAGTNPVYRLWNGRADSNHRYTTDVNVRAAMIARGYVPEGYGALGVAMCAAS